MRSRRIARSQGSLPNNVGAIAKGRRPRWRGRRGFAVNHPLTILCGTVAALFRHSYVSPLGIAAFLPDDRGSRGSGCHLQHQHLRGSCFRRVSDALIGIFMGLTVPSADPKTVWLTDLIEAAEEVAASTEPCDPAIVRAF